MNSDRPKVLHELAGVPLFAHALASGAALQPDRTVLVAGVGAEAVTKAAHALHPDITIAIQAEQRGTAHAVAQAEPALSGFDGDAIVLYGDTPFIRPETLSMMQAARAQYDIVVLGFEAADPGRYGRLVMVDKSLDKIVEFKDANDQERAITRCNSGVICADTSLLFDLVKSVENRNASGEYYLTDIVALARARGLTATAVACDEAETLGINTRAELAAAEAVFQTRARTEALETGVTLTAPETVHFALDTVVGRDVVIEPNVIFGPGVTVETGARIHAFCYLESCHIGAGALVGPFARLRPGAELSDNVKVGNFVEIKNSTLGDGTKVNHLSYIGDASVGSATNIGAGTITCNYNGVEKHRTEIGANVFIGSDTMLVAPVTVGDNAMTASGSVITKDVPPEALALSRAEERIKPGAATRLFEMYRRAKAKRQKAT